MRFRALDAEGAEVDRREYYSVGGGFVLDEDDAGNPAIVEDATPVRYPFRTGEELLARTREPGLRISDVMLANEPASRTEEEVRAGLLHTWSVMQECVERGTRTTGVLPGGLKVREEFRPLVEKAESRAGVRALLNQMIGRLNQSHFAILPAEVYDEIGGNGSGDDPG